MAERILALIGVARGPWIRTAGMRKPVLNITGTETAKVQVFTGEKSEGDGQQVCFINGRGNHEIPASPWTRVQCESADGHVICTISSE